MVQENMGHQKGGDIHSKPLMFLDLLLVLVLKMYESNRPSSGVGLHSSRQTILRGKHIHVHQG